MPTLECGFQEIEIMVFILRTRLGSCVHQAHSQAEEEEYAFHVDASGVWGLVLG